MLCKLHLLLFLDDYLLGWSNLYQMVSHLFRGAFNLLSRFYFLKLIITMLVNFVFAKCHFYLYFSKLIFVSCFYFLVLFVLLVFQKLVEDFYNCWDKLNVGKLGGDCFWRLILLLAVITDYRVRSMLEGLCWSGGCDIRQNMEGNIEGKGK